MLPFGAIALVAHTVTDGKVTTVGLRLADADPVAMRRNRSPVACGNFCAVSLRRLGA